MRGILGTRNQERRPRGGARRPTRNHQQAREIQDTRFARPARRTRCESGSQSNVLQAGRIVGEVYGRIEQPRRRTADEWQQLARVDVHGNRLKLPARGHIQQGQAATSDRYISKALLYGKVGRTPF